MILIVAVRHGATGHGLAWQGKCQGGGLAPALFA